jgi:AcrR family transcriptional regulator
MLLPKISDAEWSIRKKRIIDTAFDLFSRLGYSRVSVNDIVRSADISKGGFYTYFSSKQEIFYEILREADKRKRAMVPAGEEEQSGARMLEAYLKRRLLAMTEEENRKWVRFSTEFWSTAHRDEDFNRINSQRFKEFSGEIGSMVKSGILQGDFCEGLDMDSAVYAIISMLDGIAFMTSVMSQPLDEGKIEAIIGLIFAYLKNGKKP